ncbi:hypothetical protein [Deinococcus multiflagellatus]|uniref:Uncharacterized protein n=1 Tax=Deinococcus multiflagellatus TaxID=1656887 RepID=A0ABW1ZSV1_9DEIO|nr:hypothetical protein [Deinococcus multiflagellatus]MBZ9714494.1 hypothetical protein [Deinococcus multiflagellatus]
MDEHPPITPHLARVLIGLHLAQAFPLQPQLHLAQLALHIVDTAEALRGPLAQATGAQLRYQMDPEDGTLHVVAHAVDLQRAGSAGVSATHLGHLLIQADYVQMGSDIDLRRNLYAIAYRAQLAQSGEPAEASFGLAVELANNAVRQEPLLPLHLN